MGHHPVWWLPKSWGTPNCWTHLRHLATRSGSHQDSRAAKRSGHDLILKGLTFPAALSAATLACCRLGWMLTVVMVAYVHVYAHARACHKLDCRLPGYNFQWRIICTRDCKLSSFCITDFFQDSVLGSSVAYFQDMIRLAIRHQNCLGVIHGSTFSSRPCSDWKWRGSRGILGRNAHGAACQVLQNSLCKYQDYEVV